LFILVPGSVMIALIGYWDDHGHIPARWRFLTQAIAAIITLSAIGGFPFFTLGHFVFKLSWFGYGIGLLIILWSTNLFNFMDGADGMASVEAVFVLGIGGYLLWQVGGRDLAILAWGLVCAVLGFLYWNWPPAKIFMGDVGSTFLGFMIAVFAIAGQVWYHLSILFWFVLYSVFWFDATLTLLRRAYVGEKLYEAHRLHAFQRLYRLQESRLKLLLSVVTVNLSLSVVTLISFHYSSWLPWLMVFAILLLLGVYSWIEYHVPMYRQKKL
jgi:Fuc2NAc and GlcNAc transferase